MELNLYICILNPRMKTETEQLLFACFISWGWHYARTNIEYMKFTCGDRYYWTNNNEEFVSTLDRHRCRQLTWVEVKYCIGYTWCLWLQHLTTKSNRKYLELIFIFHLIIQLPHLNSTSFPVKQVRSLMKMHCDNCRVLIRWILSSLFFIPSLSLFPAIG